MNGRIAHLHNTYYLLAPADISASLHDQLDRLASERVSTAVSQALTQVFGDEEMVFVMRQVTASLWLSWQPTTPEAHLAERWGQQLAGSIVRHIAHDAGDGRNLVRFDNQAHFVASFIQDLLSGHAWDKWFYGAFHAYRQTAVNQTLHQLLQANQEHIPAILRCLAQADKLESLLAVLQPPMQQQLWQDGLRAAPLLDLNGLRSLWLTACQLLTQVGLWSQTATHNEALWQAYVATLPLTADWREKRSLATAVLAIIQFLTKETQPWPTADTTLSARLQQATNRLDWLDQAWLYDRLQLWFSQSQLSPSLQPIRPAATPRQQAILDDLLTILRQKAVALDMRQPDNVSNALRLYTALLKQTDKWAGDDQATALIARLLNLCQLWPQTAISSTILSHLRQGNLEAALALVPADSQAITAVLGQQLGHLGRTAMAIMADLLAASPAAQIAGMVNGKQSEQINTAPSSLKTWQPTAYAGTFLLLRACLDLRLPALVNWANWPTTDTITPLPALLLALGQRLVGHNDNESDAGLTLLAGLEALPTDWATHWQSQSAANDRRFQAALLRGLVGLRLLQPQQLFLYDLSLDGRSALIGADKSGHVCPFGRLYNEQTSRGEILADWLSVWQEATGQTPALITASSAAQIEDLATTYDQGKAALLAGLGALGNGRLYPPQADLTLSLLAMALLRVWGRWLRQFSASTPAYLLQQFIHRSGALCLEDDSTLTIALAPRPLDMILDMAGYLAPLEHLPWLPYRQIIFRSGVPL